MFYNGEEVFETPYKNYYVSKSGKLLFHTRLGILVKDKFFIDPYGYYRPAIVVEHKKQRRVFMHKLMMQTFVGDCPKGYCIDHIDYNKLNNAIDNLRYISIKENLSRSHKGVSPKLKINCKVILNGQEHVFTSITKAYTFLGLNRHQYMRIKAGAKRVKWYTINSWETTKEGVCMNLSIIQSSTAKADECKPVGDKPMIPQTVD